VTLTSIKNGGETIAPSKASTYTLYIPPVPLGGLQTKLFPEKLTQAGFAVPDKRICVSGDISMSNGI
jgi:hypothetical protein